MTSIKSLLNRMGVPTTEPISLSQNLFGFLRGVVPEDPDPSVTARVSVRQQIADVGGKHIHLNVILVGFDQIADLDEALEKVDYAIYRIHNIYRQVGIGIGRVEYYDIPSAQAGGADDIGSEGEADELSDDWSVFNQGIDVFIVRNISDSDFVGISPVGGSCNKKSKDDGLIGGEINRDPEGFSRTFAHEIGHFLNLSHNHGDDCPSSAVDQNNLMAQSRCAIDIRDSVVLNPVQGVLMKLHCSIHNGI
jgi:hypothetical protein